MKVVLVDPISSGVSLAEAFRERGVEPFHVYRPILAGAYEVDPAPGGKLLHDNFDVTCTALKQYGADAVLAGSETGVTLADELAAALGLAHNVPQLAAARRSKLGMARALEAAGVPCARTEAVGDPRELAEILDRFDRYPVVVKPVNSAGSDGIALCADAGEVRRAVEGLLGNRNAVGSINESVLLQEYLDGLQYIVNTVSANGRHVLSDVFVGQFDEIGGRSILRNHISRRQLDETGRAVVDYAFACLDALGFVNGAAHTEIRLTGRGPLLIEVNYRMMGPLLPSDVYVPAFGYSQATLFADAALGAPGFAEYAQRPYAPKGFVGFVLIRAKGSGAVTRMPGLDTIRRLPTFHSFVKLPKLGVEIKDPFMTTASGGMAYFVGADPDAVLADMAATHDLEDNGLVYSMTDRK